VGRNAEWLAIAETVSNRVLVCDSPPPERRLRLDALVGQTGFVGKAENHPMAVTRGTLYWPHGLHHRGDRLAVADSGDNRVMVRSIDD
jgi:hypothetical protein